MVRLTVWGYDRLDAMQATYGLGNPADAKRAAAAGPTCRPVAVTSRSVPPPTPGAS